MTRPTKDLPDPAMRLSSPPAVEADRLDAPDPFDPARLRLDPAAELVGI